MNIDIVHPQVYFAAFYILSFLVVLIAAIFFSRNHNLQPGSVLLVLAATSFSTVIGSRIFTIPGPDWFNLFVSGEIENQPGRSAVGGLIFGVTGFLFSARVLGLGNNAFKIYAWITPLALGIQKLGCFFNGCCYGVTTESALGITYPVGTMAHFNHMAAGLIAKDSLRSLEVLPVQLIEMLLYLIIAYIVWVTRTRWKKNISIIIFFFLLLFSSRFVTEFFRDPASSPFGNMLLGIRHFQWFLLISAISCLILILLVEKYKIIKDFNFQQETSLTLNKPIIFLLLISIFIFVFRGIFSFYEKVSLYLILIPSIPVMAYRLYLTLPRLRTGFLKTSLLALPLFIIYPTLISDTTGKKRLKPAYYKTDIKSYKRVDVGTSVGKYYSTLSYNPHPGTCGTEYTNEDYEHLFTMLGGGYSVVKIRERSVVSIGINGYAGTNKEHNFTKQESITRLIAGFNPYIKFDRKWIGAGFGLHAGNLLWVAQEHIDETIFDRGTRYSPVMPQVELRLGPKDIFDVRYSYGSNSYATFPILISEFSLGSGFGNKTDLSFRFGTTVSELSPNTFLSGEWILNRNIGMNLKYHFGTSSYYNMYTTPLGSSPIKSKGLLIFGVNYRFGFEE